MCEEGEGYGSAWHVLGRGRIWLCLARVRKGKDMALPGTYEEGTLNSSAWHG
jgi:hypothetical protein